MRLVSIPPTGKKIGRIICDGDSITEAASETLAQRYPTVAATQINGGRCDYVNSGISGQTVAQMNLAFAADIAPLREPRRLFDVAVLAGGTNDLGSGTDAATLISRSTTWINAAQAAGFKACVMTLLVRNMGGGSSQTIFDGHRSAYNAWASDLAGVLCFDAGNIAQMQDYTSATYYKDGTHPTVAGLALMGAALANTINAWLAAGRP